MQKKSYIIFDFCLSILLLYPLTPIFAATNVGSHIRENTTWTAVNAPYVILHSIRVTEGVTLTIEPGVRVEFFIGTNQALDERFYITVEGQLIAKGTEASPIVFTSSRSNPEPGDWEYIEFTETAVGATYSPDGKYLSGSIFEYVTMKYGNASIVADTSAPYLNHISIKDSNDGLSFHDVNEIFIDNSNFINNSTYNDNYYNDDNMINVSSESDSASLSVTNCTFTNNSGGAISANSLSVTNCTFTNNSRGAISSDFLSATNCTFTNNSGSYGGAISSNYSSHFLNITNCTFTNNSSAAYGGAIYLSSHFNSDFNSDSLSVTNCTFTNNSSAEYGGAIYSTSNDYGSSANFLNITNCTFTNNSSAEYDGGAIYGESINLFNTLVYNNNGDSQIYFEDGEWNISKCTIVYNVNNDTNGISSGGYTKGSISDSNIFGHGRYDINNNSSSDITAKNNYWGTTDEISINLKIADKFDFGNGEVIYYPYLSSFASGAPAIPGTTDDSSCVEFNNVLDLIFDCAKFGDSGYQFRLNYSSIQNQPQHLIWKLDLTSFQTQANITGTCMEILPDFTIKVTCAEYNGAKYSFDMHLFSNPQDSQGIYFELDQATFKRL